MSRMGLNLSSSPSADAERAAIVRFLRAHTNLKQVATLIEAGMHNETKGVLLDFARKNSITLRGQ
jgi:hypothetical protein